MTKIEMFTGKGGVGKTTMSVATALHHAKSNRTLLILTDPSGSLSEIFSKPLDRGVYQVVPNLDAVELNRALVLELWREKFAEDIYESVELLGFWFETEAYEKNNHRHIIDIPRIIFFV